MLEACLVGNIVSYKLEYLIEEESNEVWLVGAHKVCV